MALTSEPWLRLTPPGMPFSCSPEMFLGASLNVSSAISLPPEDYVLLHFSPKDKNALISSFFAPKNKNAC